MNPNNLPIQKHETAGCVLYFKENLQIYTVLIFKSWSESNLGYFMPKGHIEPAETIEQTAVRESIEETGFQNIKVQEFLTEEDISYPWEDGFWHEKKIYWFLAEVDKNSRKEVNLTETEVGIQQKVEIFQIDEAIEKLKFDNDKEVLKSAKERIKAIYKNAK